MKKDGERKRKIEEYGYIIEGKDLTPGAALHVILTVLISGGMTVSLLRSFWMIGWASPPRTISNVAPRPEDQNKIPGK